MRRRKTEEWELEKDRVRRLEKGGSEGKGTEDGETKMEENVESFARVGHFNLRNVSLPAVPTFSRLLLFPPNVKSVIYYPSNGHLVLLFDFCFDDVSRISSYFNTCFTR